MHIQHAWCADKKNTLCKEKQTHAEKRQYEGRRSKLSWWFKGEDSTCQCRKHCGVGLTPGSGRSLGEAHGHLLQCACLGNPVDRGAWWAAVHGLTKGGTRVT